MNISTGGPHLLLFERDQQLAALLGSEFQLSGYEFHTARTAVEVFDAIARHPIRLILVNLAQAATARREFWVALDTQRRGRGVQVISFHCSNLAGYGPRDTDEHTQSSQADVEIDGMLGLMNLVDAVRARVPATTVANTGSTNSQSRLSKQTAPIPATPPLSPPATVRKPISPTPPPSTPSLPTHTAPTSHATPSHTFSQSKHIPHQEAHKNNFAAFAPQLNNTPAPPAKTTAANQTTYSDKIRAVLYPNQRNWSSPGSTASSPLHENQQPQSAPSPTPVPPPAPAASSILQRLANGQVESSLAQLSRLVQEHQTLTKNNIAAHETLHLQEHTDFNSVANQALHHTGAASLLPETPQPSAKQNPPLRASPIQDLPVERPTNRQVGLEGLKRPDGPPHTELQQPMPGKAASPYPEEDISVKEEPKRISRMVEEQLDDRRENGQYALIEQTKAEIRKILNESADSGAGTAPSHEMLLDIMQSLPPMPSPLQSPQAVQPQALNGRATRSLGSVLLAGHLVPQSRLEVAQNIQRMLRGVDLNYQLGEILLMFKLLTPDQLLAASLVSYGLITTSQISALGRIRQELHSIGLEYDLENLLILFRILTPEQLREVRSGWQG